MSVFLRLQSAGHAGSRTMNPALEPGLYPECHQCGVVESCRTSGGRGPLELGLLVNPAACSFSLHPEQLWSPPFCVSSLGMIVFEERILQLESSKAGSALVLHWGGGGGGLSRLLLCCLVSCPAVCAAAHLCEGLEARGGGAPQATCRQGSVLRARMAIWARVKSGRCG